MQVEAMVQTRTPQSPALRAFLRGLIADTMVSQGYTQEQIDNYVEERRHLFDDLSAEEIAERILRELGPNHFHQC